MLIFLRYLVITVCMYSIHTYSMQGTIAIRLRNDLISNQEENITIPCDATVIDLKKQLNGLNAELYCLFLNTSERGPFVDQRSVENLAEFYKNPLFILK